jgi:hypothetical protein
MNAVVTPLTDVWNTQCREVNMDTHTTLVNVSGGLNLDQILKLFDSVRFSIDEHTLLRTITPPVENLRSLYTAEAAGLTLKLWGVSCKYNSYGQYLIIKVLNDYRKQSDFIAQIRQHSKYFTHGPNPLTMMDINLMIDDVGRLDWWQIEFLFLIDNLVLNHNTDVAEKEK